MCGCGCVDVALQDVCSSRGNDTILQAIHELREREAMFISDMSETLTVYAEPLVNVHAITQQQRDVIFFKLEEIRDLHKGRAWVISACVHACVCMCACVCVHVCVCVAAAVRTCASAVLALFFSPSITH